MPNTSSEVSRQLHEAIADGLIQSYYDPNLRTLVFVLTAKGRDLMRPESNSGSG